MASIAPQPPNAGLQRSIAAAAQASGRTVIDAGRGQPTWVALDPRAAFGCLLAFALAESRAAGARPGRGVRPAPDGLAARLDDALAGDPDIGATTLRASVAHGVDVLGFDPDAWVHELVCGVLGAGYPSPNRMLTHVEHLLEHYTLAMSGADPEVTGPMQVFGTEGGAAAMAYLFRTLHENGIVNRGDHIAIATPVFTPYLQIPVLADFGLQVVEVATHADAEGRFARGGFDTLRDPAIKAFVVVNPGNPDNRDIRPERAAELRAIVEQDRPDLVIIADTVYASFLPGFRSLLADLPRNVICLHSFSKQMGATGNRVGFVALPTQSIVDTMVRTPGIGDPAAVPSARYASLTADETELGFMDRLVADSREVALQNIAGLATPDQVQMALFAIYALLPAGRTYQQSLIDDLVERNRALYAAVGAEPPFGPDGGHDGGYYALIDLRHVIRSVVDPERVTLVEDQLDPVDIVRGIAADHGVVVTPGAAFDADSWDIRVSVASVTRDEAAIIGAAIVATIRAQAGAVLEP